MSAEKGKAQNVTKKPKMSREQMQLMIIKKKQCDMLALSIVEHLLEPNIDKEWILQNLKHINRCHMEDVIEERALSKICGYILCSKSLTIIIKQRYCISTTQNKVFDMSQRKNFCSSICYSASNYLLEQMLISPLWLRDKEKCINFKFLDSISELNENKIEQGININLKINDCYVSNKKPEELQNIHIQHNADINDSNDTDYESDSENIVQKVYTSKCITSNDNVYKETLYSKKNLNSLKSEILKISTNKMSMCESTHQKNSGKNLKDKKLKSRNKVNNSDDAFTNLIIKIEKNFKEWVTEDTLKLLSEDITTRQEIFDKISKIERYTELCKSLNRLQILNENDEDDIDGSNKNEKTKLKPQPNFALLQEESKKMELKVKAFYKGSITIDPTDSAEKSEDDAIVPLTETLTPIAIRRKIFLEKLNKILPDLLRALTENGYFDHKSLATKVLIHTFAFSSGNIILRTIEWTLVSLILIKMLSLIHPEVKLLLQTDKAIKYVSMILMSYKLDQFYLDRFIDSLLNNLL